MSDENKKNEEDLLDEDPLTGGKTVAQQETPQDEIVPLPSTVDADGKETRAGDFDRTTGAAHPSADAS